MEWEERERKSLYVMGWLLLLLAAAYLALSKLTGIRLSRLTLPCIFHDLTGWYCPGCGGTRALRLLLGGDVLKSLYYHPFVVYGVALYVWFMVSNSIEYISRGRLRIGMRYRKWYVIVGAAVIVLNFVIKNGVMLIWHYSMIP